MPQVPPQCFTFFTWPASELLFPSHGRKEFTPTCVWRCRHSPDGCSWCCGEACWLDPHLKGEGCDFLATHVSPLFLPYFSEHEWKLEGLFEPDPGFLRRDGDNKNRGLLSTPGPGVWTALVGSWALVRCTLPSSFFIHTWTSQSC